MKQLKKIIPIISIIFFLFACTRNSQKRLNIDVSHIEISNFQIHSYGKDLFDINILDFNSQISELALKYPYFIEDVGANSLNHQQLLDYVSDPKLIELNKHVQITFSDKLILESELEQAFKHYSFYFPNHSIPEVYSYISGFHFEQPILFSKEALVIGLDLYLGSEFDLYQQFGIPNYKLARMQSEYIVIDCMKELAYQHIPQNPLQESFLAEIIRHGKILYFIDAMIPDKADYFKIGYTPEQYAWALNNESNIWTLFIDEKLLFSNDYERIRKFITDGPFTLSVSREAPAALGVWIGWRIITSYMDNHPETSLAQLLQLEDPQQILKESGYKPRR